MDPQDDPECILRVDGNRQFVPGQRQQGVVGSLLQVSRSFNLFYTAS